MNYTIWNDNTASGMSPLPIVYLHSFRGNGEDVWKACHGLKDCPPMVLVSVNNPGTGLDDELSPWPAEAGGGTSALDDGGVRPAGGGAVR